MKIINKNGLLASVAVWAALSGAAVAEGHTSGEIKIYSPNSNPEVPISIQSPAIPKSALSDVPTMSPEEAEAMMEIMKVIEESNKTIEAVDDPLAGLSPDQRAFIESMQEIIPMTPEQIRMFKKKYYNSQIETNKNPYPDAAPVSRSIDLTLTPGEALPVIRMRVGNVATITFSDQLGNAWPILSVTTGDMQSFSAQPAGKQGETNILVVSPMKDWGHSNMVVTLKGHPVPILLTLDSREQGVVDFRTDIRLAATNPDHYAEIASSYNVAAPSGDATMIAFLDGVPPMGSEKLKTSHKGVQAYLYNDKLHVRTRASILSPAYTAKSTSVSGLNVFIMEQSPVILVSDNGVLQTVTVN